MGDILKNLALDSLFEAFAYTYSYAKERVVNALLSKGE